MHSQICIWLKSQRNPYASFWHSFSMQPSSIGHYALKILCWPPRILLNLLRVSLSPSQSGNYLCVESLAYVGINSISSFSGIIVSCCLLFNIWKMFVFYRFFSFLFVCDGRVISNILTPWLKTKAGFLFFINKRKCGVVV